MKYQLLMLSLLILMTAQNVHSQEGEAETEQVRVSMIKGFIGYDIPGADMAERFGNNFEVGAGFLHKTKNNWLLGIDAAFLTGETVKEPFLLGDLVTPEGFVLGQNGLNSKIEVSERGFKVPVLKVGRLFPLKLPGTNDAAGLYAMGGVGFMMHRIRINDKLNSVPGLAGDYQKGYDRLSNGLALVENIGYLYLSEKRRINFFFALEFTQAFTENRRGYNFSTRQFDEEKRLDLLWGVQAGWIFPIYDKPKEKYYYY